MISARCVDNTEVSNQISPKCIRGPFSVYDIAILVCYETISFPSPTELLQASLAVIDCFYPFLSMTVSAAKSILEW